LLRTSPGIAVLDDGRLMTGEEASRHARLLPRWTNNRFWNELNTSPLANGNQQIRHHADLVLAHLENLWADIRTQSDQVVLVVPGYYTNEHLGLLLGIAREANIPVVGVVNGALLAACNLPLQGTVLHLDVHLHAITLSRLSNDGSLALKSTRTIVETGLSTLWDRWANIIANQFIQSTRFDPMHDARSEQQTFDRLPDWIANLQDSGMHAFQLDLDDVEHSVAVSNESLLKACTPLYPQIVQAVRAEVPEGTGASLLISHRFKGFPGLIQSLELVSNVELVDLTEVKVIGSAHLHRDQIISETESISHVVQLDAGELSSSPALSEAPRATHLLWQHRAYPVGSGLMLDGDLSMGPRRSSNPVCMLYPRNNQLYLECTQRISLNGERIEGVHPLSPGDVLNINNQDITLIAVGSDG
jgi:hypothetical protein